MSTQDAIDPEREGLVASLSTLIGLANARGDIDGARRWRAVRQDLRAGRVGEWCFFVETQERAGQAHGRAA